MSSKRYAPALVIRPHTSCILATIILLVHVVAVALLWPLYVQFGLKVALLLPLLLVSGFRNCVYYVMRTARTSIVCITCITDDHWLLEQKDGTRVNASLRKHSYVHPRLIILNFLLENKRKISIPLLADSVDREILRKLRVRLFGIRSAEHTAN